MTIKKQLDQNIEIQTNLEYKQQQEFFQAIYEYFREYQEKYAEYYTDRKSGVPAFKSLIKLISASKGQISKVLDMKDLEGKKEELIKLLKDTNTKKAREKLDELSGIIFTAFEKLGISPTIHEENDKMSEFWREENHAGLKEMKKAFYDSFMLPEE